MGADHRKPRVSPRLFSLSPSFSRTINKYTHRFYDGDELRRYLNQTDGVVVAEEKHQSSLQNTHGGVSTAASALGSLLSLSSFHSGGLHSGMPSNTSRFYSVDLGLIHFVALDLNLYNGVDLCGENCRQAQLKWLEEDLRLSLIHI